MEVKLKIVIFYLKDIDLFFYFKYVIYFIIFFGFGYENYIVKNIVCFNIYTVRRLVRNVINWN